MARQININGETLVQIKGTGPCSGLQELGLAADGIQIVPGFYHRDLLADSFGPNVPPEVLWQLADARVRMRLIQFDNDVLNACLSESMGGGGSVSLLGEGEMNPACMTLGHGLPLFASGNHYISLNLTSPVLSQPWRFPSTYIADQPVYPLGTAATVVDLTWRAIPYAFPWKSGGNVPSYSGGVTIDGIQYSPAEIGSSGKVLWDHELDE